MALIMDDGTFAVGNSFVTLIFADAYHADRNNTTWASKSETEKEAALIKAFDFLSVQNWKSDTFDSDIPAKIQKAQCIGALREADAANSLQPDANPAVKRELIEGVIETEYFANSTPSVAPTEVQNLIRPYLRYRGMQMTLSRG
jgi:hypothetical protein